MSETIVVKVEHGNTIEIDTGVEGLAENIEDKRTVLNLPQEDEDIDFVPSVVMTTEQIDELIDALKKARKEVLP